MSHTKDGGLVAEASSTNRARQGSNGQSTKKASPFDLAWALLKQDEDEAPMSVDERAQKIIQAARDNAIRQQMERTMQQEGSSMAPDMPVSEPEQTPPMNPRKVGVRRVGAARGTPRKRSEMRRE